MNIPNTLTVLRLLLTPCFALLLGQGRRREALAVLVLAALSDGLDGFLARRLRQTTELGKILDPVADKLTQITVALILLIKFLGAESQLIRAFGYVFIVFLAKEGFMVLGGLAMLIVGLRPGAAEIWGKVATVVFYVTMTVIFAFGPEVGALRQYWTMPDVMTGILVVIAAIMCLAALASYVPGIHSQVSGFFREKREKKAAQEAAAEK